MNWRSAHVASALAAVLAIGAVSSSAAQRGDRALGAYLASECVTCHQTSGKVIAGIPAIAGWPEEQFVAAMHAFRNRERNNQVMQALAARLTDEDIAALAAYFGALPMQDKKTDHRAGMQSQMQGSVQ